MNQQRKQKGKRYAKIAAVVVLGLVLLVGLLFLLGVLGIPDAGLEDNSWGEVGDERIEVITTVWLDNPNPVGIGGDADAEYEIELQNVHLAEGEGTGLGVPAGQSAQELRTDLFYNQLPVWWHNHLTNGEVSDLQVNATVHTSVGPLSGSPSGSYEDTIETDIEGALDDGFSEFEGTYSGSGSDLRLPDGTAIEPTVEVENVTTQWGEVTESETEIVVTAEIHNPNVYPIPTPAFAGHVKMNDIRVADWQADEVEVLDAEDDALIPGGETEERTFVAVMDNQRVPEWFATHVDRDERSDVEIAGQFALEISGSEVTMPNSEEAISCQYHLTTAIFVDQEADMQFEQCGVSPLEMTNAELERAGATLDLTETDWWQDLDGGLPGDDGSDGGDDDGLPGGDDGDDGDDDDGTLP